MRKTHVAVGFNDLGVLLTCDLRNGPADAIGPLRFCGIDMSPFSVAKAAVLAEILKRRSVPVLHCLQVWYSATWSRGAVEAFKEAAETLGRRFAADPHVQAYLRHSAAAVV